MELPFSISEREHFRTGEVLSAVRFMFLKVWSLDPGRIQVVHADRIVPGMAFAMRCPWRLF